MVKRKFFTPLSQTLWHTIGMGSGTTISGCHRAGDEVSGIVRPALVATQKFAKDRALDAVSTARLMIVTEELVTNVLDHTGTDRDISLTLHLDQGENGFLITVEDDGVPFDPRAARAQGLPNPERGGGVGLALVKAWTDILAYNRENGRNRLVLRLRQTSRRP
jgi:serine/threonine-protein kinase RsbW